jgi:hypothetical protein
MPVKRDLKMMCIMPTVPPRVMITVDDPRIRTDELALDPFLLAAECLGYPASRCVIFEDSPSKIKAGFVVENLEDVRCEMMGSPDV